MRALLLCAVLLVGCGSDGDATCEQLASTWCERTWCSIDYDTEADCIATKLDVCEPIAATDAELHRCESDIPDDPCAETIPNSCSPWIRWSGDEACETVADRWCYYHSCGETREACVADVMPRCTREPADQATLDACIDAIEAATACPSTPPAACRPWLE